MSDAETRELERRALHDPMAAARLVAERQRLEPSPVAEAFVEWVRGRIDTVGGDEERAVARVLLAALDDRDGIAWERTAHLEAFEGTWHHEPGGGVTGPHGAVQGFRRYALAVAGHAIPTATVLRRAGDAGLWTPLAVTGPIVVVGIATRKPGTKTDAVGSPVVQWPWLGAKTGKRLGWTYHAGRPSRPQVERCREWACAALDPTTGTGTEWLDKMVRGEPPADPVGAPVWFDRSDSGPAYSFTFAQNPEPPAGHVTRDRHGRDYDVRAFGSDGRQALSDRFPLPRDLAPLCASILAGPQRPSGDLFA